MYSISIIVPIYGVEAYIERCARSLFEQTLERIEFVFIDDCTPDSSMNVLTRIIDEYHDRIVQMHWSIKIERMPRNSGLPAVRKYGVSLCSGEYIANCDSDDWVDVNMYKTMYETAKKTDSDVVVCDFLIVDADNHTRIQKGCHDAERMLFLKRMLSMEDPWSLCNKIFNRRLYSNDIVYPQDNMGEDMATCIQLVKNSRIIHYVQMPFYRYFYNERSMMNSVSKEKSKNNFMSLKNNIIIVENSLSQLINDNEIRKGVARAKTNALTWLFSYVDDRTIYSIFLKTYPRLWKEIINNSFIPYNLRIKYFLAYIRVYPILKRLVR